MRGLWTVGIWLAAAAGLVLAAVGVTYLGVSAGSLPQALGRVPGSSAHFTERGLFGVMIGGLLALVAISLHQFRPGGALASTAGGRTDPADGGTDPADGGTDPAGTGPGGEAGSGRGGEAASGRGGEAASGRGGEAGSGGTHEG